MRFELETQEVLLLRTFNLSNAAVYELAKALSEIACKWAPAVPLQIDLPPGTSRETRRKLKKLATAFSDLYDDKNPASRLALSKLIRGIHDHPKMREYRDQFFSQLDGRDSLKAKYRYVGDILRGMAEVSANAVNFKPSKGRHANSMYFIAVCVKVAHTLLDSGHTPNASPSGLFAHCAEIVCHMLDAPTPGRAALERALSSRSVRRKMGLPPIQEQGCS